VDSLIAKEVKKFERSKKDDAWIDGKIDRSIKKMGEIRGQD
jgi:hypothetical protein